MLENGFITLHRKFIEWRWYGEPFTVQLFIHLLLTANYEDKKWRDITVKRGQRITTIRTLANELKVSTNTIRLHLNRLCKTGEIVCNPTTHYTLITLPKYSQYQDIKKNSVSNNDTQPDTRSDTHTDTQPDTQPDTYETIYNQYNKDKQKEPAPDTLSPLGAAERSEEPPTDSNGFQNWF